MVGGRRKRHLTRSVGGLLAVRLLLIGNGLVLLAVGALYAIYGSGDGGLIVSGVLVALAVALFACVPLTDPYRRRR